MGSSNSLGRPECTYEDLRARCEAPWTFDAKGRVSDFVKTRCDEHASLLVYSGAKSDTAPDDVRLRLSAKIVPLEGNYLLAWDDAQCAPLRTNNVFAETWHVTCRLSEDQREWLVKPHVET